MANQESIINRWNKYVDALFAAGWRGYNVKDKENAAFLQCLYMFDRTQEMFRYEGLPDSIPKRELEMILQLNGNAVFYEHNGKLYAFRAGLGGEPDEYYRPTIATIANPALALSVNAKINEDCVVVRNDDMMVGLVPLFSKYASEMAETELSIHIASINSRILQLITAPDDNAKTSAEKFIHDVEQGELSIIADFNFLDGLKAMPYGTSGASQITDLIELEQYLKASWFNELGLNSNYNMKRESLNSAESQMNADALLPFVDNMLACRQEGVEKVNAMFGTNIRVGLASSWEDNEEEIELAHEAMEEDDETPDENTEEIVKEETEDVEREQKETD